MDAGLVKDVLTELSSMIEKINTVNAISYEMGCVDGTIIGTGRADYTKESGMYNLTIKDRKFALIDMPGIEGDESAFEKMIEHSLEQAHMVFYVNGSAKKIEKDSLEKIKKYMHDGTSVYSVFNIHCKAKKERIRGIDKEYTEELKEAYGKQKEIVDQTEAELISFLEGNYKGSISLNGLLAFCALAYKENNRTSIKNEKDKDLRKDQEKYLKEYLGNKERMLEDSHIMLLCKTIEEKIDSFDSDIREENLKKLKNRMSEMLSKITILKKTEEQEIDGFIGGYEEFKSRCYNAKEDFLRAMRRVANNAAEEAFYDLMDELFDQLEQDGGKTRSEEIQKIFERKREDVIARIQQGINSKIEEAQETFRESIDDAQERMKKDFERGQIQFKVSLSSDSVELDSAFADALKYNFKDFGKHAFTIGSLALSGAGIGSLVCPGLGTTIGATVGSVLGVLSSIWNFFASGGKRISNAKAKIRRAIDDQIDEVSQQINDELKKLSYEEKINAVYDSLCKWVDVQEKNLSDIKRLISSVENEMSMTRKKIA